LTTPPVASFPAVESARVTLNGSGAGVARWTPGQGAGGAANAGGAGPGRNSGYTVSVTGVAVSVATNVAEAECSVYVSFGTQLYGPDDFQGQTQAGSTGDTCTVNTGDLRPGDWVTAVWTGGDAGAIATAKIFGTVTPPGTGG
jgi:hypothetical protein